MIALYFGNKQPLKYIIKFKMCPCALLQELLIVVIKINALVVCEIVNFLISSVGFLLLSRHLLIT